MKSCGCIIACVALLLAGIILLIFGAGFLLPSLQPAREKARAINCASNMKLVSLALLAYATDNGDRYPDGNCAEILKKESYLVGTECKCPVDNTPYTFYCSGLNYGSETAAVPICICINHENKLVYMLGEGVVNVRDLTVSSQTEALKVIFQENKDDIDEQLAQKLLQRARDIDYAR